MAKLNKTERILQRYLAKHLETLEQEWTEEKEKEIVTLHNKFAEVIEQEKPHPTTTITVLRIIEHELITEAFKQMETKPAEEVLKQRVKKTKPE